LENIFIIIEILKDENIRAAFRIVFYLSESAIRKDILNHCRCPEGEIIVFEEMVSSEEYCYGKLSALTGVDDPELRKIIADNMSVKTNIHTTKVHVATSVFDNWPEQFKYLFVTVLRDVGIDTALKVYADLGYADTLNAIEAYVGDIPGGGKTGQA